MLENVRKKDGPRGSSFMIALSLTVCLGSDLGQDLWPGRSMGKAPRTTSHQEAVTIHCIIKLCWWGAGLGSVGRSESLRSHSSSSQQGERKHRAKRIIPNPCWFFFFCGLKRSQIGAKCPSQPPNEPYAISSWLSEVLELFVSLKGFLFGDEIQMIRRLQ